MEVHHAHHPTHKKKISEYFLEFFMLFFAVTLGFFAENYREHSIIEHRMQENYAAIIVDLEQDNLKIDSNKILITIPVPDNLKIIKKDQLDWDNYIAILGMLQTIRESTNRSYILPSQKQCHELLTLLRNYLIKHDALENNNH